RADSLAIPSVPHRRERFIYCITLSPTTLCEAVQPHQPVEPLASLLAIPNLHDFRPCDAVETVECWQLALENAQAPSVLALTRQNLPQLRLGYDETNRSAAGAYELVPAQNAAEASLFATGSEVPVAVAACKLLPARGLSARV